MNTKKARIIAFYLPQYHPIPENDEWWGKGFTEWTNVGKAKPLFRGHTQPKVPADLGYYDLRVPEVREQQAQMAKEAGIDGFCYWHYWFGNGKRLLERPFDEVVKSGKPDFPFCLGWANHSWKRKTWTETQKDEMLIEQTYGGEKDYIQHFETMYPAFSDKRYIRYEDKLVFLIWEPLAMPDFVIFKETWNRLAKEKGLNGFYFIGFTFKKKNESRIYETGFDAVCLDEIIDAVGSKTGKRVYRKILNVLGLNKLNITRSISYDYYTDFFIGAFSKSNKNTIPCVIPNFDHSPRSGNYGIILLKSTPKKFGTFLIKIINMITSKNPDKESLLFIKSWNEWGEGNYLEPDLQYGKGYLEALENVLKR